jgi:hypothetical protein
MWKSLLLPGQPKGRFCRWATFEEEKKKKKKETVKFINDHVRKILCF